MKNLIVLVMLISIVLSGCNKKIINQEEDKDNNIIPNNNVSNQTNPDNNVIKDDKPNKDVIQTFIDELTLEEKIGQLFIVDLDSINGMNKAANISDEIISNLNSYYFGGVIFFASNLVDREQTIGFINSLQMNSKIPMFISVDEEGGRVSRIANNPQMKVEPLPNMWDIGKSNDLDKAYEVGKKLGIELKLLGFNMDFAPVADINTNPKNPVIGKRAFGDNAELVSLMVAQTVRGIQDQQVSSVVKHFPGHGDTSSDTHTGEVYVNHNIDRLRQVEFLPFIAGIDESVDGIMVSHIKVPNVTGTDEPSTFSSAIIQDIIRKELGYNGLVITDAMNMGAITNDYTSAQATLQAIEAGCDIVLMPKDYKEAYNAIINAINKGTIKEERIDESLRRILEVKVKRNILDIKH